MNRLYSTAVPIIKGLVCLFNGDISVQNKHFIDNLDTRFILVAPHTSNMDPVVYALAHHPHRYSAIAKKELSEIPILGYLLKKAEIIFVDRDKPGPSAIKKPVNMLKNGEADFMIFPTGTRHDDELKGGAPLIARMAKVPLVPAVYAGPTTPGKFFKRDKYIVRYGEPIHVVDKDVDKYTEQMEAAFDQLSQELYETTGKKAAHIKD